MKAIEIDLGGSGGRLEFSGQIVRAFQEFQDSLVNCLARVWGKQAMNSTFSRFVNDFGELVLEDAKELEKNSTTRKLANFM